MLDGRWLSIYDEVEITESSDLDVDRLVPLAEACRAGARGWDTTRRMAFANDLSFPDRLIAFIRRCPSFGIPPGQREGSATPGAK